MEEKSCNWTLMKFCVAVDIWDVITDANFDDHRFGRFPMAGVEFQAFSLTLALLCQRVIIQ